MPQSIGYNARTKRSAARPSPRTLQPLPRERTPQSTSKHCFKALLQSTTSRRILSCCNSTAIEPQACDAKSNRRTGASHMLCEETPRKLEVPKAQKILASLSTPSPRLAKMWTPVYQSCNDLQPRGQGKCTPLGLEQSLSVAKPPGPQSESQVPSEAPALKIRVALQITALERISKVQRTMHKQPALWKRSNLWPRSCSESL